MERVFGVTVSEKTKLLNRLDTLKLDVMTQRIENLQCLVDEDEDDLDNSDDDEDLIFIHPPTPVSPVSPLLSNFKSDQSSKSIDSMEERDQHYQHLLGAIEALRDEVERARVLHHIAEPMMHVSQLPLLEHFADFRPALFRQKLHVDWEIFDCILDCISDSPIFKSKSNNSQLPVATQLAIFLNCAGHYGNAISTQDVAQWAGISIGSVVNCTNRAMTTLLEQHDKFIFIPSADSLDVELARMFVEARSCTAWKGGFLLQMDQQLTYLRSHLAMVRRSMTENHGIH